MSNNTKETRSIFGLTGERIYLARYFALRAGLHLEMKGIRMNRGKTAYSIIKKEFGFKGNRQRVLEQFNQYLKTEWPEFNTEDPHKRNKEDY